MKLLTFSSGTDISQISDKCLWCCYGLLTDRSTAVKRIDNRLHVSHSHGPTFLIAPYMALALSRAGWSAMGGSSKLEQQPAVQQHHIQ
jgi:hypothetical protein